MDENHLVLAASLPMWFPPSIIDGDTYIDPVYVTDANIGDAIQRGCSELWDHLHGQSAGALVQRFRGKLFPNHRGGG